MGMDPFQELSVDRNATPDEIKSAYKKMALKNHPDKGGNSETFQKISEAYNLLTSIDEKDKKKQEDHEYTINISIKDAILGSPKKVKITLFFPCLSSDCVCKVCNGNKYIQREVQYGFFSQIQNVRCHACIHTKCTHGYHKDQLILFDSPSTEKTLTFKGFGKQISSYKECPGDFLIRVKIDKSYEKYTREEKNLHVSYDITLKEALFGKNLLVELPTESFTVNIVQLFGIIHPCNTYFIKDKGLPGGDLIVNFNVEFPKDDKELNSLFDKSKDDNQTN